MVKQTEILTFGHQQLKVVEWVILDNGEAMMIQACKQGLFKAGEFSWNQGISINISSTKHERKTPQGKIWV